MSKGSINIIYALLKVFTWIFNCGDLPPKQVFIGWGLKIPHAFVGVIITSGARIGKNCTLLHNVTLGSIYSNGMYKNKIIIGDNVYIGAASIILGNTHIGDNCKVGAGTKIIEQIIQENCTVVNDIAYKIIGN